uniref:Uncharacterized protein n=1 Tax=Kalanchoe fedtschenkoi TaxID=63787 RepID=A0A7N0UB00_KALFE
MEKCEHFTIRGAVAEFRKQDWRLNYPFPIPQELTPEQINNLFPPMDIPQSKRWNCEGCVKDFIEGDHPDQLTGAGPSVVHLDVELVTERGNSSVEKANDNTNLVAKEADDSTLQPTYVGNVGVEGATFEQHQTYFEHPKTNAICDATDSGLLTKLKPKVIFDLNEPPTLEAAEPMLEINAPPSENLDTFPVAADASTAAEGVMSVHPDCGGSTKLASVIEQHEDDSQLSPVDDNPIATGNDGALRRRKAPKYRTVVDLLKEGKGEKFPDVQSDGTTEIVPTPNAQPKKTQLIEKKKSQETQVQDNQGPKLSDASKDAAIKDDKNRAFNFNLPLEQNNILLNDNNQQLPPVPCGKRKRDHSSNQNNEPSEMGTGAPPSETGKILLPKKRRIFGNNEVHNDGDPEKFRIGKSGSMKVKHASKIRQGQNLVAECQKVRTTQSKKSAGKGVDERNFGAEKQKKNHSVVSGSVSEQRNTDERQSIVGKELVLGDRPISTRAQDDAPINEILIQRGRQICKEALRAAIHREELRKEKIDTGKRKMVNHPANCRSTEHGSKEKQNINLVDQDGTVPPTRTKKSVGIEANRRISRSKNKKKSCDEKSAGKDAKQHMPGAKQKRKRNNHGDVRGNACGQSPDERRPTKVRKALVSKDSGIVSPQFLREQDALAGMRLLSMVAAETEDSILPIGGIREEVLFPLSNVAPLRSNILSLGYSGCARATVPSEDFLIDEAEVELLMLGPEDLPLRSHRVIKPIAAQQKTVVKCVDSGRQLFRKENSQYQRRNAVTLLQQ